MASRTVTLRACGPRLVLVWLLSCAIACTSTQDDDPEQSQGQQQEPPDGGKSNEGPDADEDPDASEPVQAPEAGLSDADASVPDENDPPVVGDDSGVSVTDAAVDDPVDPDASVLALTPCPEEDATVCPASDPLCYWESGPSGGGSDGQGETWSVFTGWSVCTRFCEVDADCPSELGTASCVESGSDRICLFECTFGRSCPGEELSCSNGDRCGLHFCECTGRGCDDPFCHPE